MEKSVFTEKVKAKTSAEGREIQRPERAEFLCPSIPEPLFLSPDFLRFLGVIPCLIYYSEFDLCDFFTKKLLMDIKLIMEELHRGVGENITL